MAAGRTRMLLLAGVFAAAALMVARQPGLAAPGWLLRWEQSHPDPRVLSSADADTFSGMEDSERREDLLLLLAALAAGCLAAGCWPRLVQFAGGSTAAVLVAGSVAVGGFALAASAVAQVRGALDGSWTLGDDNLDAMAGDYAATLRDWRTRIAAQDAVIVAGTDQPLLNVVAWALHPRALYPVLKDVPPAWSADELRASASSPAMDLGRGHAARWLVDLHALRAGAAARHPALVKVDS